MCDALNVYLSRNFPSWVYISYMSILMIVVIIFFGSLLAARRYNKKAALKGYEEYFKIQYIFLIPYIHYWNMAWSVIVLLGLNFYFLLLYNGNIRL